VNETLEAVLRWGVPAAVVFGVAAVIVVVAVWTVRRARRSPRAREAAEQQRARAGIALVALDDAIEELDLEVGLSGALYDGTAPAALRRARMIAQHARDDGFAQLRDLTSDAHPSHITRVSSGIRARVEAASAQIARARSEHVEWMAANRTASVQVEEARARAAALRADIGDAPALVAELAKRFDPSEVADARRAAGEAADALETADRLLVDAADRAADPSRSALGVLAEAERALRRGQAAARTLEEQHRIVTDAAQAVTGEIEAARTAFRQAERQRVDLEPADAERLGAEVRALVDELAALEPASARRPAATVAAVARLRDRLDLAVGDARTAQQRLRGARTALPGTLAAARAAVGRAETAVSRAGADARVRLTSAQHELASARSAQDPVAALDAARRALRHAEDAVALADYDRITGG
jgi:DNA repair exonuclease SbcCD ATPase subunit